MASDEALHLLRSIDASLKLLVKQQQATAPKAIASDRDLDGKYGDPLLRFMPRDWTGASFKNRHFSECPPALLELVADSLDWFGKQADEKGEKTDKGKPVGDFKRADAARARGWAKRLLTGLGASNGHSQQSQQDDEGFGDDSAFDQTEDSFS